MPAAPPRVVLASASPRRLDLLSTVVDPARIDVREAAIDESTVGDGMAPLDALIRISRAKAEATWTLGDLLLAADTLVLHDGRALGKPADRDDAFATVAGMRGDAIEVVTNVVVMAERGARRETLVRSQLHVGNPSDQELRTYVASGAADDKAGSLEVQDRAAGFVTPITGCWTNVLGLPLCAATRLLGLTPQCVTSPDSPAGMRCPELAD